MAGFDEQLMVREVQGTIESRVVMKVLESTLRQVYAVRLRPARAALRRIQLEARSAECCVPQVRVPRREAKTGLPIRTQVSPNDGRTWGTECKDVAVFFRTT
jgi:hypothetical protein